MAPFLLYLVLAYLLGSAGLYLFSAQLRAALHTSATGNTSVLNGLRHANRRLAILNLVLELLKPVLLLGVGYGVLGISDKALLFWGVVAALAGRMMPLYLGGKHGGKGTLTIGMGTVLLFPELWWIGVLVGVAVLTVSKFWKRAYRPLMTFWYLLIPVIGYFVMHFSLAVVLPMSIAIAMTLLYGRFRAEDGDQGFTPLYK